MAIYGDNDVYANSPVAAYSVGTRDGGIISGGTGGETMATQGVNFKWVYDPDKPEVTPSGFTGGGWYEDTQYSPIWYSSQSGIGLDDILDEFKAGTRTTLNDVFTKWQECVNEQGEMGIDVLQQFQLKVHHSCWTYLKS